MMQLARVAAGAARQSVQQQVSRCNVFAVRAMSTSHTFAIEEAKVWGDMPAPATEATATKEELLEYFRMMYTVRRVEIASDVEYKARNIRGFCHLYDGQEAVAMGMEAGLDRSDSIITTYRCHGIDLVRGDTVEAVMAEMFGFANGNAGGKGGSMHLYHPETNYWGGCGIVGAQVPLGAGIAWANKYLNKSQWPVPVSVGMFGDGAANQGQIWEAANLSKLWNLPMIFMCENNQYGMGTATDRSSANPEYYTGGGRVIPGLQVNGMNVLAVREAIKTAKEFVSNGNGPMFFEAKTYRYHGHSMSDPGLTYRDREEVAKMRSQRDCIEQLRGMILEADFATADELKALEKEIRGQVAEGIRKAKAGSPPAPEELYTDIYAEGIPEYVRGVEITGGIQKS